MIIYPKFANKKELHDWLHEKKADILFQKKSTIKHCDSLELPASIQAKEYDGNRLAGVFGKAENVDGMESLPEGTLKVRSIINTTNIIDSHMDLHVPGLWKQSLNSKRKRYLLNQHKQSFEGVISRDVTPSTKKFDWSALGYEYDGKTEALVYESIIRPDVNPYMYEQYMKGFVYEHSVGMQYVNLFMCVNSEDKWWKDEKEAFDKYFPMVANPEVINDWGMFWAVTEAKDIEGSAVLFGSNHITPTISIQDVSGKGAVEDTLDEDKNEPPSSTQEKQQPTPSAVNLGEITKSILNLKTKK